MVDDCKEYPGMAPLVSTLDKIMFSTSAQYNSWAEKEYGVSIGALGLKLTEVADMATTEQIRQLATGTVEENEALLRELGWKSFSPLPDKPKPKEIDLVKEMLYLHFTGVMDSWGERRSVS